MERDAILIGNNGVEITGADFESGSYEPSGYEPYAYDSDYHALSLCEPEDDLGSYENHNDNGGTGDDHIEYAGSPQPAQALLKTVVDVDKAMVAVREIKDRPDQAPLMPLELDVSGETESPVPISVPGNQCACCGLQTNKLWQGARTGLDEPHAVCTLCYLTGHLDSPTAAHGQLAYLPGLAPENAIHLQRRALLAILGGTEEQQAEGERIWSWMNQHAREVEVNWGTARAGEIAHALKRLSPGKRNQLQQRLAGCVLMLPADMFSDLSLLLPANRTVESVLTSYSWATYTRSDLYVEPVMASSESEDEQAPDDLPADRP
ncbi:hypothetical protein [Pseudomonas ovata]|uniref:hypothetical protein n=1 Tax=Pseudomonas ovata TaxID=1839709 RepID=UPI001F4DB588|nr:hypothetical protein [Pseudomonas ovata]